jgi:hypothetical protein
MSIIHFCDLVTGPIYNFIKHCTDARRNDAELIVQRELVC